VILNNEAPGGEVAVAVEEAVATGDSGASKELRLSDRLEIPWSA